MRWVAGHHQTCPPLTVPDGARILSEHSMPVWVMGGYPHRTVTTGQAALTIIGRCSATTGDLLIALRTAMRKQEWSVFSRWSGSYLTVITTGSDTVLIPDLAGVWPLYYTLHDHVWRWSTRARPLAQATDASLDVEVLAAHMAAPLVEELRGTRSLWRGIHQVPPRHALHLVHSQVFTSALGPLSGLSSDQVPNRLRTALTDAVDLRVEGEKKVSTDLSGGVDSTTITLLAARSTSLYSVTYTALDLGNHVDLHHARVAAATTNAITHRVVHGGPETLPYTDLQQRVPTDSPSLDLRAWGRHRTYLTAAAHMGSTVHLTGNGGDNVLSTGPAHLADLLATGQRRRAWTQTLAHARLWRVPAHRLARAVHRLARTRYPDSLGALAGHLRRRTRPERLDRALTWTAPTATASWFSSDLSDLLARRAHHVAEEVAAGDGHSLPGQWADHRGLSYYTAGHINFLDLAHHDLGVDITAPFLDNEVVRATLAAPSWSRADSHRFKPTLRMAMADFLPSEIGERSSKDSFTTHAYQGLRHNFPAIHELITSTRLGELGLLDTTPVIAALNRAVNGRTAPLGALAQIITTEMWMRSLDHEPEWWVSVRDGTMTGRSV